MRARAAAAPLAVALLIAGVYHALLGADFVYWDDHALFTHDPAILDFAVRRFFTDLSVGGFFPLARLSLALDHLVFGYHAAASHAVNIGLHFINACLAAMVARRAFGLEPWRAWAVSLLFAVHPMNVEVVAWVSGGRKDLLCTLFYFATLALAAGGARAWAFATGLLAHLAKASAVTLGPWLTFTRPGLAAALWPLGLGVATLELVAQRTVEHVAAERLGPLRSLGRALSALTLSIGHYVWPRDLAVFYDPALVRPGVVDVVITLAVATLGLRAYRQRKFGGARGLFFFALALAPTLKLVPFGQDSAFNDRYLYLPSVGFLSFLVAAVPRAARGWITIPVVAWATIASAQTAVWLDQEVLWLNVIAKYPRSRKAAGNLTLWYAEHGRIDRAEPWAKRSVDEAPGDVGAISNYGVVLTQLKKFDEARAVFEAGLNLAPRDPQLLNNLGYVYLNLDNKPAARAVFTRALEIAPDFANARAGLRRAR